MSEWEDKGNQEGTEKLKRLRSVAGLQASQEPSLNTKDQLYGLTSLLSQLTSRLTIGSGWCRHSMIVIWCCRARVGSCWTTQVRAFNPGKKSHFSVHEPKPQPLSSQHTAVRQWGDSPKYFRLILGDKTNFPMHLAAFSSKSALG